MKIMMQFNFYFQISIFITNLLEYTSTAGIWNNNYYIIWREWSNIMIADKMTGKHTSQVWKWRHASTFLLYIDSNNDHKIGDNFSKKTIDYGNVILGKTTLGFKIFVIKVRQLWDCYFIAIDSSRLCIRLPILPWWSRAFGNSLIHQ